MPSSRKAIRPYADPILRLDLLGPIGVLTPEVLELFDHIEDLGFWMKDLKGRFLWVSVPWMMRIGLQSRDRARVIGRTDYDFFPEELASQYQLDDESVQRGVPIIARIELVGGIDQPAAWNSTTKIPLRDAAGRIVATAGCSRPLPGKLPAVIGSSPVSAAIAYISRNYSEPISNAEMAKACGLSERVFQRRFNSIYHCSPHTYLRRIRVRLSCNALVYSSDSITEIAHVHGFADQSHFTKEFHRIVGETPRKYRLRHQEIKVATGRRQPRRRP